ncbi:MAG: hypothetical protein DMD83_24945 [Candidatus Rokuibacteriota bacterium]|nr:MAG: hypothetical protein DMD83_24945 [Candidatus Rokubacteria bacterium]
MGQLTKKYGWVLAAVIAAAAVGYCGWLVYTDAPAYRFLVRLYVDKKFLKQTLRQWGVLAPLVFIGLQALQVIISPIPGEATGFLGGYLFGEWLGLIYSTIGLTLGSVVAFWIGRWLGEHYVRNLVSKETWNKLGVIVEAEGAILCFIIYVILLPLRHQPHAPLGLRARLGRRPHPRHLGALGPGRSCGERGLHLCVSHQRHLRRRRAAAVLLPAPPRGLAARPQGREERGGALCGKA